MTSDEPSGSPDLPTLGSLFERHPERWGTRGDPYLWDELRELFRDTPLPDRWFGVNTLVEKAFLELTGEKLSQYAEPVFIERFVGGDGAGEGHVSQLWWATIGEALIVDRWAAANPAESNRFPSRAPEREDLCNP